MENKGYATAEDLLAENLKLHETLMLAQEELEGLKNMLDVARTENLKAYRAYFEVSERLRNYENREKVPLLKRLTQ